MQHDAYTRAAAVSYAIVPRGAAQESLAGKGTWGEEFSSHCTT